MIHELQTQEASGVVQSKPEGLRTGEANSVNASLRAGKDEMRCPSSAAMRQEKGANASFFHLFVLFRTLTHWMMPSSWRGQLTLLSPPAQILVSSRNTLTDNTQK